MRRIDKVAAAYRARGHKVSVLSTTRCLVTDAVVGNSYQVTNYGRVVTPSELMAEQEGEEPHLGVPADGWPAEE